MKIVDLSQSLFDKMPVYPGDPECNIAQIHFIEKDGWNLRYLKFSSHIGTHADAFSHMVEGGAKLDELLIERFIGEAVLVGAEESFPKSTGLAFRQGKLTLALFKKLKAAEPRFVIVGDEAELAVELERKLLQNGILTITDLVNMKQLPKDKPFMFYGVPLKIKDGDGSPIRAFAVLD